MAIITMLVGRGLIGELVGSFFIIVALTLWIVPGSVFSSGFQGDDPAVNRVSRIALGFGLGLLAAAAAALLLPAQIFSWLVILIGAILIVWIILEQFR
jgi:hypothetical protein